MGIQIDSGITIGSGITISSIDVRSLLSAAGQTAYDAAATDAWYSVSASDFANVKTGLASTSTIGYSDAQLTGTVSSFSQNFGATLDQANATVTGGNYILGFVSRAQGASGGITFSPRYATSFKGAYVTLGSNQISMTTSNVATPAYWLRKNPAIQGGTVYVAVGTPNGGAGLSWAGTGTWGSGATGGGYTSNNTSWTDFNTGLPAQQWLLTTVRQW